jgi:hypothetical protein
MLFKLAQAVDNIDDEVAVVILFVLLLLFVLDVVDDEPKVLCLPLFWIKKKKKNIVKMASLKLFL